MFRYLLIGIVFIGMISSCTSDFYTDPPLTINPKKVDNSQYAGEGVYMVPPPFFTKASTFNGFKSSSGYSSVSVIKSEKTLDRLRKIYVQENLDKLKTKLIELRPITYGEIDSSFFAVVFDRKKSTYRYNLIVDTGLDRMVIKGWCFKDEYNNLNQAIRESIFSAVITDDLKDSELFLLARFVKLDHFILTKDGEYPTKSDDDVVVEVYNTDPLKGSMGSEIVKQEVRKSTGVEPVSIKIENLENGKMISGFATANNKKGYTYVIGVNSEETLVLSFRGNSGANFEDFTKYVNKNYLHTGIK